MPLSSENPQEYAMYDISHTNSRTSMTLEPKQTKLLNKWRQNLSFSNHSKSLFFTLIYGPLFCTNPPLHYLMQSPPPEVPVSFAEVHPILNDKCSGGVCHGGGLGNPDIDKAYETIIEKNLCKNIWFQIQYGKMPIGKGCTGDPVEDSKIDGCLNEEEYQLVKDWANGEIPCAE